MNCLLPMNGHVFPRGKEMPLTSVTFLYVSGRGSKAVEENEDCG